MLKIEHLPDSTILKTVAHEKLDGADYERLQPIVEGIIERHGKIRWYFEMNDFDGWTLDALWKDAKLSFQHAGDFERIAIVGRKDWMDWMTQLMKPFTSAEVKYFELEDREAAMAWIEKSEVVRSSSV